MEKIKIYGCLLAVMINCFTIGIYAMSTKMGVPIESYRWVITSLCVLGFIFVGVNKINKL